MEMIERRESINLSCGDVSIMVDQQGAVYLAPDFDTPRAETDLAGNSHLAYWSGQDWCCAIGLQGRDVLIIRLAEQCAVVGGQLDRLDFHDGYDPGGLHRIEIHDLPDGNILIIHELGVARVSAGGFRWQRRHEDMTARVVTIADGVIWFEGDNERFAFDLEHGNPLFTSSE